MEEIKKLLTIEKEERVQNIISHRPYNTIEDLRILIKQSLIDKYYKIINGFNALDQLVNLSNQWQNQFIIKGFKNIRFELNNGISLKDYQLEGVKWLLNKYQNQCGAILADEMGLGKTCQVITLLSYIILNLNHNDINLIVVPASVLDNWIEEFNKFCKVIKVLAYKGTQSERARIHFDYKRGNIQPQVIISTYNLINSDKYDRHFFKSLTYQSIILDEGHLIKNQQTQNYQYLSKLKCNFKLILTGTPLQNNLMELFNLFMFFNQPFCIKNNEYLEVLLNSNILKFGHLKDNKMQKLDQLFNLRLQKLKKLVDNFILRRTKEDVLKSLPIKTEKVIKICLEDSQKKAYNSIIEQIKDWKLLGNNQLMDISFKLRRIANHVLLIPKGFYYTQKLKRKIAKEIIKDPKFHDSDVDAIYEDLVPYADSDMIELCQKYKCINKYLLSNDKYMNSGKVKWMIENLPKLIQQNHKIIIFSQFVMVLDILETVVTNLNIEYLRLDGATAQNDRQNLIHEFNNNRNISIFLLSTKAASTGINLTSADTVILHDLDHNPQNDRQAEARAHRVGQTKDVTVYKLITLNTIEVKPNILIRI
ncbi:hypothetical protein K502DRAFT_294557 [Neoconidiobolus thromboides FSU 785]|nr:hypothetical protein K502DRAFT_294557 [Neoconidiobolus thromboides FSU 785]